MFLVSHFYVSCERSFVSPHILLTRYTVTDIYNRFDAPALFARDIDGLETFVRAWCGPEAHPQHHKITC